MRIRSLSIKIISRNYLKYSLKIFLQNFQLVFPKLINIYVKILVLLFYRGKFGFTTIEISRHLRLISGSFLYNQNNILLARYYAEINFHICDTNEEIITHYVNILILLKEFSALRDVYFIVAKRFYKKNDITKTLNYLNLHRDVFSINGCGDIYIYDNDVINIIRKLAKKINLLENNNYNKNKNKNYLNKKIKVGHIVFGLSHKDSIILKLISQLSEYSSNKFEHYYYICESSTKNNDIEKSNINLLKFSGGEVFQATSVDIVEGIIEIANQIISEQIDVVLTTAVLARYEHLFLLSLLPKNIYRIGLCYGPLEQYYCRQLNHVITSDPHISASIDNDNVSMVRIEIEKPEVMPNSSDLLRRSHFIDDEAIIIMSGGRLAKFLCNDWWETIFEVLEENKNCYFMFSGVNEDNLKYLTIKIPEHLKNRIIPLGWSSNIADIISASDIFLDTFPNGGGVIILIAQSLGKPIITFSENLTEPFDGNDWNPAAHYMPNDNFIVPRGNFNMLKNKIIYLVKNQEMRILYGQECKDKWTKLYSNPIRMVINYENIILSNFLRSI